MTTNSLVGPLLSYHLPTLSQHLFIYLFMSLSISGPCLLFYLDLKRCAKTKLQISRCPAATFDKQRVCKLVQRKVDGIYDAFPLRLFNYPWFLDPSFYNGIITIILERNICNSKRVMKGPKSKVPFDKRFLLVMYF